MLQAALFDQFKGATSLLLWGDEHGMQLLLGELAALREGDIAEIRLEGPAGGVTITTGTESKLLNLGGALYWQCSQATIDLASDLTAPLLRQSGHQYLDVSGLAEQVIIARDEYPADLRQRPILGR